MATDRYTALPAGTPAATTLDDLLLHLLTEAAMIAVLLAQYEACRRGAPTSPGFARLRARPDAEALR